MRLGEDVENLKSMIETEDRVETTVSLDSDLHDAKQVSEVDDLFAKSGMYSCLLYTSPSPRDS